MNIKVEGSRKPHNAVHQNLPQKQLSNICFRVRKAALKTHASFDYQKSMKMKITKEINGFNRQYPSLHIVQSGDLNLH